MKKLKMQTTDLTEKNIRKLAKLFPSVVTEMKGDNGTSHIAVNFELLRQELSGKVIDGAEAYDFTWVGKRAAIVEANTPIRKTLRPAVWESSNWDTTENLYIEGDNLDALKLLQESYLNSIKLIYIDPPYNTGNDSFVYRDDFSMDTEKLDEAIEYRDEEGNIQFRRNTETNPRFHSDWCSMIYPRLKLARNLLTSDGVIFISIDDNEGSNLKKICDEVFGEQNFVAKLVWENKEGGGSSDSRLFRIKHEYILCYAKEIGELAIEGVEISNLARYSFSDEYVETRGKYYLQKLGMGSIQYSQSLDYPIETPDGSVVYPADNNNGRRACWRWSRQKLEWGIKEGFVEIKKDSKGVWTVYTKQYLKCDNEGNPIRRTQRPMGVIDQFSSTQATKYLRSIGMDSYFTYSKPFELIKYLVERIAGDDFTVLDFFSGSATTAHAVMQLNAEDRGKRKFIMVQLPEPVAENSAPYKAGLRTIAAIGKERIRRSGEKIAAKNKATALDIGFRVFKIDDSNMKDVYYSPAELTQDILFQLESNIKEDRTDLDLLYGVLVDWGLPLSLKHEVKTINGIDIHIVDEGSLIACFAPKVSEDVVRSIARMQPLRAVFRDGSFSSSSAKINLAEIFKSLAPTTTLKVL